MNKSVEALAHAFKPSLVDVHEELLSKTDHILEVAKSRGWGIFGSQGTEKDLCLYEAAQYEAQAKELRAAIALLSSTNNNDSMAGAKSKKLIPTSETVLENGDLKLTATEQRQEEVDTPITNVTTQSSTNLILKRIKRFLFKRIIDGDLEDAHRTADRIEILAKCLKIQSELDLAHWKTGGGYVKPEEVQLLYLVRQIIICEGEKERFHDKHPNLNRHNESELQGELVDISKRLLRYKSLFHIQTGSWFTVYGNEYQVAADPHFPESRANPFHVQCFFDGTIREEDLQRKTIGERIQEAENKRRPLFSPLRSVTWGSKFTSSQSVDGDDSVFSLQGFLSQMTSSFFFLGQMLIPSSFFRSIKKLEVDLSRTEGKSSELQV